MVMKQKAMGKNLRQSILKSFGRYLAIVLIIALGAGLFVGLLMTKADMVETGQRFMDQQNMFDIRMVSNYGWSKDYVEKFSQLENVTGAEGLVYMDAVSKLGDAQEDVVFRFYSMPETMNRLALRGGRWPETSNECLADGFFWDESILGQTIRISDSNEEDALDGLKEKSFTVVGYIASPLYMDMNRGTTSVGSGILQNYFYIPMDAFNVDYFTEINLTINGSRQIYSQTYHDSVDAFIDSIEEEAERLSEERYWDVKQEVQEEYADGYQEFLDGLEAYIEGKREANRELADALKKLQDGEQELKESKIKLLTAEDQIKKGREQLRNARKQLEDAEKELASGRAEAEVQFAAAKALLDAQYAQVKPAYDAAMAAISQAQAAVDQVGHQIGIDQLDSEITALNQEISYKNGALSEAQAELDGLNAAEPKDEAAILAAMQKVSSIRGEILGLEAELAAKQAARVPYEVAQAACESVKAQCQPAIDGMNQINAAYAAYESQKAAVEAEFAQAEAQIAQGWKEIRYNDKALDDAVHDVTTGWEKFHDGEKELADGWIEYEDGKREAEQELEDAEKELKDAEQELIDARKEIDDMDEPDLIILDRGSNVGYNNLDSSSDIVQGVSRVFPVFFLLVASLVCITTMTRMIDEERIQIGTLKALGYSNWDIISKYLFYSGSAALLGCGLGLLVGCTIFPMIIWRAYCIMLYITPEVTLTVNWPLCFVVTAVYAAVLMLVTWYSCRRALEEEPAELIRPKAPDPGKKILLEYLPFWKNISFLNKVTIRNIFRYRQRLAMMLVGIGGCTALLVTGFGLRDSIVNVVDYQFEDVTLFDMEVYFREEPDQRELDRFQEKLAGRAEDFLLYHQSSVDLSFDDRTKEIYMIAAGDRLADFMNLHNGEASISLPGKDHVVLSIGVSEALGIDVGDQVTLRNADMQILSLTVSGIYENHVYNYAIVSPETMASQWKETPAQQMAFVKVQDGQDVHAVSADLTDLYCIMNVSVSADTANMVKGMMDALDLVVWVIVFCAGLLAVVVLYNLTNININERIREIATIKVLGFYASETGAYVFKENLILTVAGAVLGLVLGKLLLVFVMSQIKIDMVWFKAMVEPVSYVWSIALTLLSAIVVDYIFYFKLDKINMAEALKSVE